MCSLASKQITTPFSFIKFLFLEYTGNPPPVDRVGSATPDKSMYSDGYLMILSNKNNPIVQIDFQDMFPISLGALSYDQGATDVEYLSVSTTFAYNIYTLTALTLPDA